MAHCGILGAGNWATAFAVMMAGAGHTSTLVARRPEVAEAINTRHRNPAYLSDVELSASISATTDLGRALADAEVIVVAIPAQQLRRQLTQWSTTPAWRDSTAPVLSLMKGLEAGTNQRMSQVIAEAGGIDPARLAVLSGPNLAGEIAQHQPSLSVIAAHDSAVADQLQQLCLSPSFRTYTETDVVGVEIAGATKNVIALAAGMGVGLGYGHNALASLITRGLSQMAALGEALGGHRDTFAGLAGLGDLLATCNSPLSRNRTFGQRMGEGMSLAEATAHSSGVAEGVATSRAVQAMASTRQVDMPIVDGVVRVIDGETSPADIVRELMGRRPKSER